MTPDFEIPQDGLHIRWPDFPGPQIEARLEAKKAATLAFAEANPIDRRIFDLPWAHYGIVTTGKAHLDLMEALRLLGIDRDEAARIGLDVYKVGMVWPLAHDAALSFVRGKREVLVIEEKRGIIESQFKEYFYDYPGRKPERMVGKEDEYGQPLVPWVGELSPLKLASIVAQRLDSLGITEGLATRAAALAEPPRLIDISGAERKPYFCSGCPHNSSTRVPEGSQALAGIGCHFMASWMDRDTDGLIQMGGEGVNWIPRSMYNGGRHVFQNLGDGTYYHSGSLAIRQALAAKTNITYKILFNDAVAMTGGQPVDGPVSVPAIAHSVRAEGVQRIALVTDEPQLFDASDLPAGTTISHRRELDAVQRELREIPGVSILIYAQTCATEKRRRRKRGLLEDPARIAAINDRVCEGCGDCSVESNCLSVVPLETPFGRKRQIDQNNCNKDFSCLNGFCPSFVTVENATKGPTTPVSNRILPEDSLANLPAPDIATTDAVYDLLVTGVGGTGVITVGAIITMAAHLEGKGASVLDFMGFAQKFGPVLSYIRLADSPDAINQVRIDDSQADALIGCDLVVSSSPQASRVYRRGRTRALVNDAKMSTADFLRDPDANLRAPVRLQAIGNAVGENNLSVIPAHRIAERWLGDTIYANVITLGAAFQAGLLPLTAAALHRAIELNGVKIDENLQAFALGRLVIVEPNAVLGDEGNSEEPIDAAIERRERELTAYQNSALAKRFRDAVDRVRRAELDLGANESLPLTQSVLRSYYKTLAYKDEYEVARLYSDTNFIESLRDRHGSGARLKFHLAPPFLPGPKDVRGRPRKREFGSWVLPLFKLLAPLKILRGTAFDPFGRSAERCMERELITEFEATLEQVIKMLDADNLDRAVEIFERFMKIRGYGPVKEAAVASILPEIRAALASLEENSRRAA